jgi:two-component system, cell cycle sensor histidine kinase and response regulator CckA
MLTLLKVLLIEDSPDDATLLIAELKNAGFDPAWKRVDTEPAFRAGLAEHPEIIFSDFTLPQFSVGRALEILHESKLEIPFIVVSGTIGEERAVESLKAGATDYVLKDRPARLGAAVHRALRESKERKQLLAQLLQAQKMESIGRLAGGIAHDFNNILTVIQGHASLMLSDANLDQEMEESAEQISLAAERGASLTRQLLTFSRQQVIQSREVNLNHVIEGVIKMLRRVLGEDIMLEFLSGSLPPILADAGMLEQVLMNLVVNARDAMPRGGRLRISTSTQIFDSTTAQQNPEASPGQFVCLAVADTGCGIAPENISRIFEPFFTTKEVGKGTGLGLATVYGIVKQHSGWITLESELNRGTTFKICFPATSGQARDLCFTPADEKVSGGSETILLVEDETPLRRLVRSVLESYGYRVLEAESGHRALRLWKEHRSEINLLLTDLVMPGGMTGRDLADLLRQENPALRIIFMSGYGAEVVGHDFRLRPDINFLQKPYAPRTLAKCVRSCLDKARA